MVVKKHSNPSKLIETHFNSKKIPTRKNFFALEKYVNTLIVTELTFWLKKRVTHGVVSLEKLVSLQARKTLSGIGLQYFKY